MRGPLGLVLIIRIHAAKFHDPESSSVQTDSSLSKKYRLPESASNSDAESGKQHDWPGYDQQRRTGNKVESPLFQRMPVTRDETP